MTNLNALSVWNPEMKKPPCPAPEVKQQIALAIKVAAEDHP